LKAGEWIAVGLHLPICGGCRNYRKHISLLRTASRELSGLDGAGKVHSDD